ARHAEGALMGARKKSAPKWLFRKGDRVAVLGLGVSGTAAARLIASLGGEVYASDAFDGPRQRRGAEELRAEGIEAETGRHDLERILECTLVVTSPGIDPSVEVRRAVREAGLRTVAEIEIAFRELRSRVIGITGTNGKTTTTALCGHLLETAGVRSMTAGNIGRPLSEIAMMEEPPEWVVVELSSFQLADLEMVRPDIGVLLNLAPDHLDRYASVERYYEDKRRLFANATDESRWVINLDDPEVVEMARHVAGVRYGAALHRHEEPGAFVDEEGWMCGRLEGEVARWARVETLPLLGRHNVMNALMAGLAAALAGCGPEKLGEGLRSFHGLPHRLQPVGEFEGVLWVNDSKATNVSATRVALGAFQRPVVAVLGGRHKGEPYASLLPTLEENARAVIAFGEAAPRIVRELGESIPLQVAGGMEAVVREAKERARPGDVVLFSPACSSYDMFPNYEERGHAFERAVRAVYAEASVS
ncbi:MAG: UDP-N-acetylmuramoyl-L-alanine--D-glutamate ligase, partial [Gemmatimonadota bacterium]